MTEARSFRENVYRGKRRGSRTKFEGATVCWGESNGSTLAWEIPWMEEPGRLQSMGLLRVGHG